MGHTAPSFVLDVVEERVVPDLFTLEDFLHAQKEDVFYRERDRTVWDF